MTRFVDKCDNVLSLSSRCVPIRDKRVLTFALWRVTETKFPLLMAHFWNASTAAFVWAQTCSVGMKCCV